MQLISRNITLTNQRLDNFSKEVAGLKKVSNSLKRKKKKNFNKINETISTLKKNLFSLKKDTEVIQTSKPSWATDI